MRAGSGDAAILAVLLDVGLGFRRHAPLVGCVESALPMGDAVG